MVFFKQLRIYWFGFPVFSVINIMYLLLLVISGADTGFFKGRPEFEAWKKMEYARGEKFSPLGWPLKNRFWEQGQSGSIGYDFPIPRNFLSRVRIQCFSDGFFPKIRIRQ